MSKLLNEEASYEQVLFTIREAGREIQPGDIFLLSYSGHGSQIINEYYHEEDEEYHDQTWCLFDRMLIDDELREAFKGFAPGARILVISDSCFSGTITRVEEGAGQDFPAKSQREEWAFQQALRQMMNKFDMKDKALPAEIAKLLQQQHHETFQAVQDDIRKEKENGSVRLASNCSPLARIRRSPWMLPRTMVMAGLPPFSITCCSRARAGT